MAFRLDKAVIRGEIANITPNQVTGRIWLVGMAAPIELKLTGNCLRDLAGCSLKFINPHPLPDASIRGLTQMQEGKTGDMTASRKSKVPSVDETEIMDFLRKALPVPCYTANTLYLEWFSETNHRVVVESTEFELQVSAPEWSMSATSEESQIVENQESFFRFLNELAGEDLQHPVYEDEDDDEDDDDDDDEERPAFLGGPEIKFMRVPRDGAEGADDEDEDELDISGMTEAELDAELEFFFEEDPELNEFEWEQEFREADRRAAAYQEAFDRYRHHPERERMIAEAMGWDFDHIQGIPQGWEEVTEAFEDEWDMLQPQDEDEVDSSYFDKVEEMESHHPLSRRAMRFALKLQKDAESIGLIGEKDTRDSPLVCVIVSVITLGGKLAAALDGVAMGYDPDPGFVVAMLKRAQIPLNEAMHYMGSIDTKHVAKDAQMWLATARSELFDLRKDILDIMKEMREL
jgi:hypothetical protein